MKKVLILLIIMGCLSFKSDKRAYKLFSQEGKEVSYKNFIKDLLQADIVFFGEYHNNPISHWLQYEVTKDVYEENKNLILGAEMFEKDNQMIIDEYLEGTISSKKFESECKLWQNYSTDYEPLLYFAKENSLRFIATNIPRRYADIVHRKGLAELEKLGDDAKKYIADLPIKVEPDSILMKNVGIMASISDNVLNIAKAQSIKDATMAQSIYENIEKNKIFIHYNGSFHSDNWKGIVKYLKDKDNSLKIKVITTVQQEEIEELDETFYNMADYIICIPYSMTRTY